MTAFSDRPTKNGAERFSVGKDEVEMLGRVVSSTSETRIKYKVGDRPYRGMRSHEKLPDRLNRLAVNHARRHGARADRLSQLRASLKRAAASDTSIADLMVGLTHAGGIRFTYTAADGRDHCTVTLVEIAGTEHSRER